MNSRIFVDSFAWIAIINKSDNYHQVCVDLLNKLLKQKAELLTTNYILIETINSLSKAEHRKTIIGFMNRIEMSPSVTIFKITDELYQSAWHLYTNPFGAISSSKFLHKTSGEAKSYL